MPLLCRRACLNMHKHIEQQSIVSALMLYKYVQKCLLIILYSVRTYIYTYICRICTPISQSYASVVHLCVSKNSCASIFKANYRAHIDKLIDGKMCAKCAV